MSVRSHVYSSCFARHTAESSPPFPGKNVSASRATEWTSKTVPYASKTSAAISCDIGPPGADATIGAARPKVTRPTQRRSRSMFSWEFPYSSQRMPVMAKNVVATSQPLAAQAGLQMLAQGGNAVDAGLAAAITLAVVEPTSNGIGSDVFALLWDGQRLVGLNASGCSPAGWTPPRFAGKKAMPPLRWDSGTLTGAAAAATAVWEHDPPRA